MKVTIKGLDKILEQINDYQFTGVDKAADDIHQESLLGLPIVFVEDVVPASQKIIDGAFVDKPQTDASRLIEGDAK